MALSYCQHCEQPMTTADCDVVTVPEGYSYHKKCHKCYVCSDTDLANAEIFQGVLFCNSCSRRIFQCCSTVKRTKHDKHRKGRRYSECRYRSRYSRTFDRVIEMAKDCSSGSETTKPDRRTNVDIKSKDIQTFLKEQYESLKQRIGTKREKNDKNRHKNKVSDITKHEDHNLKVTREILEKMFLMYTEKSSIQDPEKSDRDKRRCKVTKQRGDYSDLRVAELGVSTEIANMPLRRKSEVPVILNKIHPSKSLTSYLCPNTKMNSDLGGG